MKWEKDFKDRKQNINLDSGRYTSKTAKQGRTLRYEKDMITQKNQQRLAETTKLEVKS